LQSKIFKKCSTQSNFNSNGQNQLPSVLLNNILHKSEIKMDFIFWVNFRKLQECGHCNMKLQFWWWSETTTTSPPLNTKLQLSQKPIKFVVKIGNSAHLLRCSWSQQLFSLKVVLANESYNFVK
jgi:hypothetical protein